MSLTFHNNTLAQGARALLHYAAPLRTWLYSGSDTLASELDQHLRLQRLEHKKQVLKLLRRKHTLRPHI